MTLKEKYENYSSVNFDHYETWEDAERELDIKNLPGLLFIVDEEQLYVKSPNKEQNFFI